jgi:DNA-binding CsgD family transcriptional regulator
VDFVPTSSVPVEVLPSKGSNRNLRAGQVLQAVRGWALRERIVQLHVFEGKTLKQCARLLGRSYKRVSAHWAAICREVSGDSSPQKKEEVRAFADLHLREFAREGRRLFEEGAAYGAVGVQAIKALCELHGVKAEEGLAAAGFSLEDVGREVRVVSPLLMYKIDRVQALCGPSVGSSEGGRAAARARWDAREVPVEGAPVGLGGVEPG